MIGAVFHHTGLSTNIEKSNIFDDKISGEGLEQYLNHHSTRDEIISNLLIHDFPANANGSGSRNMAVIVDVKMLQIDKKSQL